ncbi:Ig-like domain-containing protein [Alteromonas pelagimontana]|uniref:Ig-like domain-containing protein n=1 Tax=Alteromonas pelagimontana TaxID=1858656 RepID=A0A6M4MBX6_9ALTE|nr:Ig-like domain-containing protein [Alteromonas pelagimontana]QJR80130.1 Ig-like domain-containing protein [Alteromonas pelagimontana]
MITVLRFTTLLLVLPAVVFATHAEQEPLYKVELEDGTVLYTDTSVKNSEPVELDATTQNTTDKLANPVSPPSPPASDNARQYSVSIISPQPEATIRNNSGNLTIQAQASPKAKAQYQLWLDGNAIQRNNSGTFSLTGIDRGAHSYSVHLLDNKGKTLASTEVQTLYLHQASALINTN